MRRLVLILICLFGCGEAVDIIYHVNIAQRTTEGGESVNVYQLLDSQGNTVGPRIHSLYLDIKIVEGGDVIEDSLNDSMIYIDTKSGWLKAAHDGIRIPIMANDLFIDKDGCLLREKKF